MKCDDRYVDLLSIPVERHRLTCVAP